MGQIGFGLLWGDVGHRAYHHKREDDDEEEDGVRLSPRIQVINVAREPTENGPAPPCVFVVQSPAPVGMNLAAALAAERQLRAVVDSDNGGAAPSPSSPRPNSSGERSPIPVRAITAPGTPSRVSLMRLLEETDGYDGEMNKKQEEDHREGSDSVCCVCMGRKKGAAFIPCGHTFCRVCSRELWLNEGLAPSATVRFLRFSTYTEIINKETKNNCFWVCAEFSEIETLSQRSNEAMIVQTHQTLLDPYNL
ncbi:UNVERIFIED_CONTAM: hypothetical protein Sradi_2224700 [Sesamum radiatum]|uniref:RING-type domain-containing protein n=1 Tax=Sesamum radiatum TaxID=300843 RepID=A0AAW2T2E3_SESRA